jgi:hypothetical protein
MLEMIQAILARLFAESDLSLPHEPVHEYHGKKDLQTNTSLSPAGKEQSKLYPIRLGAN